MIVVVGDMVGSEVDIIRIPVIVDIQDGLEGIIRMGAFEARLSRLTFLIWPL